MFLFLATDFMISERLCITTDSQEKTKTNKTKKTKSNNKRKLMVGNYYKRVSSPGKNMLHCSGYFSYPLLLHISHWRSLWRCKSY